MEEHDRLFDVCIVCAMYEEAEAVLDEFSVRCKVSFASDFSHIDRYHYRHTTITNTQGEPLTVLVTWPSDHGPVQTGLDLKPFLHEFRPRFLAMTGICAGDRTEVQLGDPVVAECAYFYEEGKFIRRPGKAAAHLLENRTFSPTSQMLQYTKGFDSWKQPITKMKRQFLKKRSLQASEHPKQHIAPMASGMAVRSDDPFPWLRKQFNRNTIALDMEAATFYRALGAASHIHGLVVKGVCDYADMMKGGDYHAYAARVSAVYLLIFIQEFVNEHTMPRRDAPLPSERARHLSPFTVPYLRNPFFTGRETEIRQLHSILANTKSANLTRFQALSGLGGIGKTQVAIEYAYRYQKNYSAILWAGADSPEALVASYIELAETLQLSEWKKQNPTSALAGVKRWLGEHTGWLLVLDNIEDLNLVEKFVPVTKQGVVLLITQREETEPVAHVIPLADRLLEEESICFLLKRSGCLAPNATIADASPDEITNARTIVHLLEGLLLALDQAGAYIREIKCSLQGYLERYQQQPAHLLDWKGRVPTDHPASVMRTFSMTFDQIRRQNPTAAEVLKLCAFLAPDAIPEELITIGATHLVLGTQPVAMDFIALDKAMEILLTFSLVKRNPHSKAVSVHRLVQDILRHSIAAQECTLWVEQTVQAVNTAMIKTETEPSSRPTTLREWSQYRERYLPHLRVCAALIEHWSVISSEAAELLDEFAHHLYFSVYRGSDDELVDALQKAAIMWQKVRGPEDLHVADCLHSLATHYSLWLQRTDEAKALFERVSSIIEQHSGSEALNAFEFRVKVVRAL